MKKFFLNSLLIIFVLFISLIIILSTVGIETNKFNKLISDRVSKKNINLELENIKFKINPKKLNLFLNTNNPKITFREVQVPIKNIKVYVNFLSLLNSEPKIEKTVFKLEEIDITEFNKLSSIIKPSNFKSFLNNKIKKGKLISEVEFFLSNQEKIENFLARGTIKDLKVDLLSDLNFDNGKLSFFADKDDILIQNIFGNLNDIKISDGDIKLNLENGINLKSNFKSKFNFDKNTIIKYNKYFNKFKFISNFKNLQGNLNNNVSFELDDTYEIKDYDYNISGVLEKGNFEFINPIKNSLLSDEIKAINLLDFNIIINHKPKKTFIKSEGKYSFNNLDFFNVNFRNDISKDKINLDLNLDYGHSLELDLINYKKNKDTIANLLLNLEKNKNQIKINTINFKDKNDSIKLDTLIFDNNKFITFKKIEVLTSKNAFFIQNGKKILIQGDKFDATNLAKFFKTKKRDNIFKEISNNIEIDLKKIRAPLSEKIQNFKLLGEIKNGQFTKISSKGDFGGNNFLDITMKKDKKSEKKYLEIYSDLTRPLLTEYSFFNGLSGGKLLFTSVIDKSISNSKLKIEDFKIINAPGLIKLLSLADLGGLVDLVEGEGLSFDLLEIEMETSKNNNYLKLNEILALGPSMSVLMEGYQDKNGITSLKGTLVPAKTLNTVISKIPVLGNIVIPKEVGEGLFGISFKMKGPEGNIKTTIDPIKTLTPRFIQKIIEKNKGSK